MSARLAGLYIHPVKSAAGIRVARAKLGPWGLEHDREWMVVDPDGRFLTQREEPRLALLKTAIDRGALLLANPEGAGPRLALDHEGAPREVQVWKARCAAFDAGEESAAFLSGWLGRPLRLVRFDARQPRHANPQWTGGREVATRFSDGYPMLVLSQGSIDDLAARVGAPLPVERFRPNLLLDGLAPYAEDAASELQLDGGAVRIALTKACTRCVITTIDQQRGESTGQEPLRTLRGYRFDAALRGVVFGRNAYTLAGEGGMLSEGMAVTLS